MLISFLVKLNIEMKAEGLIVAPEQLCSCAKYILFSSALSPDPGLQSALFPIVVNRLEEEPLYEKAWNNLRQEYDPETQLKFYHLLKGEKLESCHLNKLSSESGLQWEPWQHYLKYSQNAQSKKLFETAVLNALAYEENLKKWESALEAELERKFREKEPPAELERLLQKALSFRKEFAQIRKHWNQMKTIVPKKTSPQDKVGEKRSLRPQFIEGWRANLKRFGDPALFNKRIEDISETELLSLQSSLREMAQRLRLRLEGMRKQTCGKLDLKKTLRKSYKTFGEPMRLFYVRPKRKPTKWIILSDISGSVKQATRIFMSFLFELKQVMAEDVRAFVFVSKVQEITHILQETHYETMLQRIYTNAEIDFRGYSDYGVAFQEFDRFVGDSLDRETILLIIGDARNNKRDSKVDILKKWANRKLIWFNPDIPEKWDQGDSIISVYARFLNKIYDVSTPGKLVSAIEHIIV